MLKTIKKVLIVEDDLIELSLLNRAVKDLGYNSLHITHAKDGEHALTTLNDFTPQLIILDLSMPKMNGLELLKELKSNSNYRDIPVVVFTSSNKKNDSSYCFENGASGYIVKPTAYVDYRNTINTILTYWDQNEKLESVNLTSGERQ
jgi:CheY-like chemotaxis protein